MRRSASSSTTTGPATCGRLNTNVYIKRDDLTGIGLGGNKVRKLEFLLADAKRKGAEVVFTTGGAGGLFAIDVDLG